MGRGPPGGYEAAIPAPSGAIARTLCGSCRSVPPAAGEGGACAAGVWRLPVSAGRPAGGG